MRVFVFDRLAYARHLDRLKTGSELPYHPPPRMNRRGSRGL